VAEPSIPEDVCLVCGLLSAWPQLFGRAETVLRERFGPVLRASEIMPFDFTDYYRSRMGENIQRKFLAFERLVDASDLAQIKLWTNAVEKKFARGELPVPRPINIDPGYLTPAKLVLATTKNAAHRIYLDGGIYAEVTLSYQKGQGWQAQPWTYPDYRTEAYSTFFEAVRSDMRKGR